MLKLVTAFAATRGAPVWGRRVDAEKTKGDVETFKQAVLVSAATKSDAIGVFDVANKENGEAVSGEVRPYPKHIIFHAFLCHNILKVGPYPKHT